MQQQNSTAISEDEIDLRELFKTLAKNKKFIFLLTFVTTFLAIIYLVIKKPIYEIKSVVRIGYISSNLVENSDILETKLKLIFNVDSSKKKYNFENGEVTNISAIKKAENFLEITTQAFTNEKAETKNKEVLEFLQNEYKYKIDDYNFVINSNIKKLEEQLKSVENIKKVKIQEQINFLMNVDLVAVENKLKFNKEKLVQYQENVNNVLKNKSSNDTQNMLSAIEILNYQNLILNIQNQIENLNIDKQNIISEKIPNLKRTLEYDISNEIISLNYTLSLEKLKLTNSLAKNSEIVGEVEKSDDPIKPKKVLIIVIALITGLIFSIFIVFIREFIENNNKNK